MRDNLANIKTWVEQHKRSVIFGAIFTVSFLVIVFLVWHQQWKVERKKDTLLPPPVQSPQNIPDDDNVGPRPAPEVFFESYENKANFPQLPSSLNTYILKKEFTKDEILELGRRLGLTESKSEGDYIILSNTKDANNRGMLVFNQETGLFTFESYGIHKPQVASEDQPTMTAKTFLTSLGVIDETVDCSITYQQQDLRNVTFVECHRDWDKAGLPILNFAGVLNIQEDKRLTNVFLGGVDENTPNDPSIINVSTGDDGKVRPNDFNTITVAVSGDGRILTIASNIRQILATKKISSGDLLTPYEALDQFLSHNAQLSLTIPAGSGVVDWDKVYLQNKAHAQKAIIEDYVLTYLEKPPQVQQEALVPMYLIRGTAQLYSGYIVRFVETVPALRSGLSFLEPVTAKVAGVANTRIAQRSIHLGTFFTPAPTSQPTVTPTSTPTPYFQMTPTPTPEPGQYNLPGCEDLGKGIADVELNIPGLGTMRVVLKVDSHTFFLQEASFPIESMEEVRDAFFAAVEEQYIINISRWLQHNSSTLNFQPSTVDDMFSLFMRINSKFIEEVSDRIKENPERSCDIGHLAPPIPNCIKGMGASQLGAGEYAFDIDRINNVSNNVAQRVLQINSQGEILVWADRENLFPPITLDNFVWVFIRYSKSGLEKHLAQYSIGEGRDQNSAREAYLACYISGVSPSLYLYPKVPTQVTVRHGVPLTYSDPGVRNMYWEKTAYPDGTLSSSRSRLYYEYDRQKVFFSEPKQGFIIPSFEWKTFIGEKLAQKLNLTVRETEDLLVEVRNALYDIKDKDYQYLKISFIDSKELEANLPLSISPQPNVFHRVHLLLTPLKRPQIIDEPNIDPLTREGFTVIELGAIMSK